MKNRKKRDNKKLKKKKNPPLFTALKQQVKRKGFTLFEIAIIVAILCIIGNFLYQIIHWREIVDSAKQLGVWGCIGAIIAVILLNRLIDFIFDKLFD